MTQSEIKEKVYAAIEYLERARPGRPVPERVDNRRKGNEILSVLPKNWWRRLKAEDVDVILEKLGDVA